ncbi:adenosylcobalamin-dependent ribonucleoside-diphosphate reductase [Ascidiimonas aurantiaca]|uniref:adenosylcobalamin-dependent ribonucleoside-diphosphate reductase n=1 Tax=Ascidiimonas aurantiaca TaxID=1685432 RepID=UPI0030EF0148
MAVEFTKNALQILRERYLLKDDKGVIVEKPDAMFRRVARAVAKAETNQKKHWEDAFYQSMSRLEFLPNSPALMNAGLPNQQLSACFVLPVKDNLESIFQTLTQAALIHKNGGGTGYNFSAIRPRGDRVAFSGEASGPIAFMKVFDTATEQVKQSGKRRGANMGILNVDHPDIELFVTAKSDGLSLQNFNSSVGITNAFMKAVEAKAMWSLINPRTGAVVKEVEAFKLWKLIVKEAWKTGDPGLLFLDHINDANPIPEKGPIQSTNPCGEVPLLNYESCTLGSINVSKMICRTNPDTVQIDWQKLAKTIELGIRFLDNVITVNYHIFPEIKTITQTNRKIGLGVMGWAELLFYLAIPYASEEAVELGELLMKFIKEKSYETSVVLAKERGTLLHSLKRRNATCNSIAPTGTISVIAQTSYSIEPLFALAYERKGILNGKTQTEMNTVFRSIMESEGLWSAQLKEEILKTGTIQHITSIPKTLRKLFKTSLEIPWKYHLLHQKAFQDHTDNAVSKTINLPETATVKDVYDIYVYAWKYRLKGITIYRDKSRLDQVLQACRLTDSDEYC